MIKNTLLFFTNLKVGLFFLTLCLLCNKLAASGQESISKEEELTLPTVVIHADHRLSSVMERLEKKNNTHTPSGKARGFRVQIYNGNNRSEANAIRTRFVRTHAGIRSYVVFKNPQYRVRVGDFRNRKEAHEFMSKINSQFGACMIVQDIINTSK